MFDLHLPPVPAGELNFGKLTVYQGLIFPAGPFLPRIFFLEPGTLTDYSVIWLFNPAKQGR